jgi:hypothetical protein
MGRDEIALAPPHRWREGGAVTDIKSLGRLAILPVVLLALLLQANAVVRSAVMQAAPWMDGAPICSAQTAPASGHSHAAPGPSHHRCPYCEVAAHAPVIVAVGPLPVATLVTFVTFAPEVSQAPPVGAAIETRARGPPLLA